MHTPLLVGGGDGAGAAPLAVAPGRRFRAGTTPGPRPWSDRSCGRRTDRHRPGPWHQGDEPPRDRWTRRAPVRAARAPARSRRLARLNHGPATRAAGPAAARGPPGAATAGAGAARSPTATARRRAARSAPLDASGPDAPEGPACGEHWLAARQARPAIANQARRDARRVIGASPPEEFSAGSLPSGEGRRFGQESVRRVRVGLHKSRRGEGNVHTNAELISRAILVIAALPTVGCKTPRPRESSGRTDGERDPPGSHPGKRVTGQPAGAGEGAVGAPVPAADRLACVAVRQLERGRGAQGALPRFPTPRTSPSAVAPGSCPARRSRARSSSISTCST